jgi:pimeloyl-ACP methyl ester carboxylesterase
MAAGVLLMSFGHQPRSWVGDLGSHCAHQLCEAGYPVFRFDMPGLGDSPGELPVHLEELWNFILKGGHAAYASALAREISRQYPLQGLILGGFCGGAATALLACDPASREIQGLILLEPEIGFVPMPDSAKPQKAYEVKSVSGFLERRELLWRRLHSPESWRRLLSGKSDFNFWARLVPYALGRVKDKLSGHKFPPETNLPLIKRWKSCAKNRMPMLVLSVGNSTRRKYYESYGFAPGRSVRNSGLTWMDIEGTTHAMVSGGAKDSVPAHLTDWMQENFPIGRPSPLLNLQATPRSSSEMKLGCGEVQYKT